MDFKPLSQALFGVIITIQNAIITIHNKISIIIRRK